MKVVDPGHVYDLAHLDGDGTTRLTFVKREGDGYPGNTGHHEGTNLQEVLRALISRVMYLDGQIPDVRNRLVVSNLRDSIFLLESRAAERHYRKPLDRRQHGSEIEQLPVCSLCGHIGCDKSCAKALRDVER